MMRKLAILILIAQTIHAAPAPYPLVADSQSASRPALTARQANGITYRVTFRDGGQPVSLTSVTPYMVWATGLTSTAISQATPTIVNSASGIVDFVWSPSALNTNIASGVWEVGLQTAGIPRTYTSGAWQIMPDPYASGAPVFVWTTNSQVVIADVDWSGVFPVANIPNLPQYVPTNRVLTINGTAYSLDADRSWTVTAVETDNLQTIANRERIATNDYWRIGGLSIGRSVPGKGILSGSADSANAIAIATTTNSSTYLSVGASIRVQGAEVLIGCGTNESGFIRMGQDNPVTSPKFFPTYVDFGGQPISNAVIQETEPAFTAFTNTPAFRVRPTVNGTNVLLSGETTTTTNGLLDLAGVNAMTGDSISFATENIGVENTGYPVSGQTNGVWVGRSALYQSPGSFNSAMGYASLYQSPGSYNSAMGYASLYQSPGSYNSAMGILALFQSPGSYNSAMGDSALYQSPGSDNSAMGRYALYGSAGSANSAIGRNALYSAPGSGNSSVGFGAGYYTGGASNLFLGCLAGYSGVARVLTNAIAIGAGAVPLGSHSMVLGNPETVSTRIYGTLVERPTVNGTNVILTGEAVDTAGDTVYGRITSASMATSGPNDLVTSAEVGNLIASAIPRAFVYYESSNAAPSPYLANNAKLFSTTPVTALTNSYTLTNGIEQIVGMRVWTGTVATLSAGTFTHHVNCNFTTTIPTDGSVSYRTDVVAWDGTNISVHAVGGAGAVPKNVAEEIDSSGSSTTNAVLNGRKVAAIRYATFIRTAGTGTATLNIYGGTGHASVPATRNTRLEGPTVADNTIVVDAPADGTAYGRNNNAWVSVATNGQPVTLGQLPSQVLTNGTPYLTTNDTRAATLPNLSQMSNVWVTATGVGIGTNNPANKLDVFSASSPVTARIFSGGATSNDYAQLLLRVKATTSGDPYIRFAEETAGYAWSAGMDVSDGQKFKIHPVDTLINTSHFTIERNGNVGLGTNTPATPLDVNGATTLRGTVNVSGYDITGVNAMTVSNLTALGGNVLTNNGFKINGAYVTNGSDITISGGAGGGGISNVVVNGKTGVLSGTGSNVISTVALVPSDVGAIAASDLDAIFTVTNTVTITNTGDFAISLPMNRAYLDDVRMYISSTNGAAYSKRASLQIFKNSNRRCETMAYLDTNQLYSTMLTTVAEAAGSQTNVVADATGIILNDLYLMQGLSGTNGFCRPTATTATVITWGSTNIVPFAASSLISHVNQFGGFKYSDSLASSQVWARLTWTTPFTGQVTTVIQGGR